MLHSARQLLRLFSRRERIRLGGVLLAMFTMGIMQMLGVSVILPFVSLLSNPSYVQDNELLNWVYQFLGFESTRSFLILIGSVLLLVLVGSNAVTATTIWLMTHFAWRVQRRISARLLSGYLHQPYEAFLNRNSADIGKNILMESQQFANGVLINLLKATAYGITALMIIGFLIWVNPLVAIGVAAIFVSAYLLVYVAVRRVLLRIGKQRMQANTKRFQAVHEAFGSVKEVKILGREEAFLNRYIPSAQTFATCQATSQVLGQVPRFAIEGLAFGLVMAFMLYLLSNGYPLQNALPMASAFIVAGYRLLPALQNVFQGVTQCRYNQAVLDTLVADFEAYAKDAPVEVSDGDKGHEDNHEGASANKPKLDFNHAVELKSVNYVYPGSTAPALKDISLSIPRNSFVALTGTTGAGKTTLADLILGLLEPSGGEMWIDDVRITNNNVRQWQANIGYVPQDIYLTDNTIASNIAYGVNPEHIDQEALIRAAKIANIHDFIVDKLEYGFDTVVGERGVRLSGGQRQRIGIARALYHDPQVIVLDEATSALDNETERRIVNELDAMRGGRTLIVIAHRLTTVQKCHNVFILQEGKVVAQGSYEDLIGGELTLEESSLDQEKNQLVSANSHASSTS